MAEELEQIMQHIYSGHHFLLSGGAGSGKTYTLVQVIKRVIAEYPTSLIACITYTNAAVREIESRVNDTHLRVSTIHDFLWDCIGNFQNELRDSLLKLINTENIKTYTNLSIPIDSDFFVHDGDLIPIKYKEYVRLHDGIISHDEVLKVAQYMFAHYPKLCAIVKGSYPFIFIDEYQDTSPLVISTLLDTLSGYKNRPLCLGFFGDSMQAIYPTGIGDLKSYIQNETVYEVKKEQNYRSPKLVIDLANRIRFDGLQQHQADDIDSTNRTDDGQLKIGRVIFLYTQSDDFTIDDVRNYLQDNENWSFDNSQKTKELNLTHKLIAGKAGFPMLMEIHGDDGVLKYRDRVKDFVKEHNISTEEKTFNQVIQELGEQIPPTRQMQVYINNNQALYNHALEFVFDDFVKMYVSADQLIDDKKQDEDENSKTGSKRSDLVTHLMNIERCIYLYSSGNVNEFLKVTEKKINSISDRRVLHQSINQLVNVGEKTIGEIIDLADVLGIVRKDEKLEKYQTRNLYVYERVMDVPYTEVQALYKYLEGMTPFSTQHKTKGTEFDNVLVILDNGGWNNYNFENMFTASQRELSNSSTIQRSRKLFYVCCTRTKENLAVFFHKPSASVLSKAQEWFGDDNVIPI